LFVLFYFILSFKCSHFHNRAAGGKAGGVSLMDVGVQTEETVEAMPSSIENEMHRQGLESQLASLQKLETELKEDLSRKQLEASFVEKEKKKVFSFVLIYFFGLFRLFRFVALTDQTYHCFLRNNNRWMR
jgi:hypothetical protein